MELLRLSKFKLQLRALIAELGELKEKEQSSTQQLHQLTQKRKQTEEDFTSKLHELQDELASSRDSQSKLQTKVQYLENDKFLLESKQKELKEMVDSLLQSRETFVGVYEDSTCELRRSIEVKDRKLSLLTEKIKAHFLLLESIEKEAISVKQVVANVQQIVSEKEGVVAGLTRKMDQMSGFGKEFFDKIHFLENKLRCTQQELRRKDAHISELRGQLEAMKISNDCRPEIEELQKSLSMKNNVIQDLISEKKALRCEVRGLEIALQKVQNAVMNMDVEDQKLISSALEDRGECTMKSENENDRSDNVELTYMEESLCNDADHVAAENKDSLLPTENKASSLCHDSSSKDPSNEQQYMDSCISEVNCTLPVQQQQDSECSTTEAAASNSASRF